MYVVKIAGDCSCTHPLGLLLLLLLFECMYVCV